VGEHSPEELVLAFLLCYQKNFTSFRFDVEAHHAPKC